MSKFFLLLVCVIYPMIINSTQIKKKSKLRQNPDNLNTPTSSYIPLTTESSSNTNSACSSDSPCNADRVPNSNTPSTDNSTDLTHDKDTQIISYAKSIIKIIDSDRELFLDVIRKIFLKLTIYEVKIDESSKINGLTVNGYSHTSAKASLDFNERSQSYFMNLKIKGINMKISGRYYKKNPWYLPNIHTNFTIIVINMDIDFNVEFNKKLEIIPGRSKFQYLNTPKFDINLYNSGCGRFIEYFAEKIISMKKTKILAELGNGLNKMLSQRDIIKNKIGDIFKEDN